MTCGEFGNWLDEGRPEEQAARMITHAATCAGCERELGAATELDRLLAIVVPATVAAGFSDAVLRRIRRTKVGTAFAAFLQILGEPSVPLSLALIVMLVLQSRTVASAVIRLSDHIAIAIGAMHVEVTTGFALAAAPLFLWIGWRLFRTFERLTSASAPLR